MLVLTLAAAEDPCKGVPCSSTYCPPGTTATLVEGTEGNCCRGEYKCVPVCSDGLMMCTKELQAKGMNCIEGKCVADPARVCCDGLTASCQACTAGTSIETFCEQQPSTDGCEPYRQDKVGGATKQGCLTSAGYSWCDSMSKCVRPWEEKSLDEDKDGQVSEDEFTNGCTVKPKAKLGNPASLHCASQGGKSVFRNDAAGNVIGYCQFGNGVECEEWAYFRKECAAAPQAATPVSGSGRHIVQDVLGGGFALIAVVALATYVFHRCKGKRAVKPEEVNAAAMTTPKQLVAIAPPAGPAAW